MTTSETHDFDDTTISRWGMVIAISILVVAILWTVLFWEELVTLQIRTLITGGLIWFGSLYSVQRIVRGKGVSER